MPAITINIPEPPFQEGDIFQLRELVLHVWRVEATGHWGYAKGKSWADCLNGYSYSCTVQGGNGPEGLVRPGTVLCFNEQFLLEQNTLKIEWSKEIVTPDTNQNYRERKNRWQQSAQETQY